MTSGTPAQVDGWRLRLLGDLWRQAGRYQNSTDGTKRSIGDGAYTQALVVQGELLGELAAQAHRVEQLEAALDLIASGPPSRLENGEVAGWAMHVAAAALKGQG